jgi:ribosomal-protein-alanine N-acetyltransferase
MRRAPEEIETARLLLRRPRASDAEVVFVRYASDPDVTRYLSWPRHRSVEDTRIFMSYSDVEWEKWGCGPYLIIEKAEGQMPKLESHRGKAGNVMTAPRAALLGSTGLSFESPTRAMTGYVLAKDAWGRGFATEALGAMVALARSLGVTYLFALCNAEHRPSWHVLEKGGLTREIEVSKCEFPNLAPGQFDTYRYSIHL